MSKQIGARVARLSESGLIEAREVRAANLLCGIMAGNHSETLLARNWSFIRLVIDSLPFSQSPTYNLHVILIPTVLGIMLAVRIESRSFESQSGGRRALGVSQIVISDWTDVVAEFTRD